MTSRFSITIDLHGIPSVRHVLDIKESIRLAIERLCSQVDDRFDIHSHEVKLDALPGAMTVRFTVALELHGIPAGFRLLDVGEILRRALRILCCQGADRLTIEPSEAAFDSIMARRPPGSEKSSPAFERTA